MKKALFFRNQDFSSYSFHVNKTLLFSAFPLICFLIQDVCNRLPLSRQWPGCGLQLLLAITQTVGYLLFASNLAMCSLFLFLCPPFSPFLIVVHLFPLTCLVCCSRLLNPLALDIFKSRIWSCICCTLYGFFPLVVHDY